MTVTTERRGLGRGLGELFQRTDVPATGPAPQEQAPSEPLVPVPPGSSYADLSLESIVPNPRQPRTVFDGDALDVVERLPDASLSRVYLLHPDPWRKARHAKRRMVNHGPLDTIAAKLKPGAEFRLGTDDPTYCRWSMMIMDQRRDFTWQARTPADFLTRPDDWPETRYEQKARAKGHEVWYFRYRRL